MITQDNQNDLEICIDDKCQIQSKLIKSVSEFKQHAQHKTLSFNELKAIVTQNMDSQTLGNLSSVLDGLLSELNNLQAFIKDRVIEFQQKLHLKVEEQLKKFKGMQGLIIAVQKNQLNDLPSMQKEFINVEQIAKYIDEIKEIKANSSFFITSIQKQIETVFETINLDTNFKIPSDTSKNYVEQQNQVQNVQRNTTSNQQPLQQIQKTYTDEEKLQQIIKALNLNFNKADPKYILQDLITNRTVYQKLLTINSSSILFENIVAYGELQSHKQTELEFLKLFKIIDQKQLAINMFIFEHYLGIMGVIISFRQPNKHYLIYDEIGKNLVNFKESFKQKLDLKKMNFNLKIKIESFKQIFIRLFDYYGQGENIQLEKVMQLVCNIFSGDTQTYLDLLDYPPPIVV